MKVRTKKKLVEALGLLCWFLMLGVIGGTERGFLPLSALWGAAGLLVVGTAALYKAGVVRF